MDTSNLVVTKSVAVALALEPLHTEQVQVPLVLVLSQTADLETRVRLPVVAVAVSPPDGLRAADTVDGNVGTDSTTLTLVKLGLDLFDLGLDDSIGIALDMGVGVGAVLGGNGDLEKGEEREEHARPRRGSGNAAAQTRETELAHSGTASLEQG